jgi:CHAT domain-containing protein
MNKITMILALVIMSLSCKKNNEVIDSKSPISFAINDVNKDDLILQKIDSVVLYGHMYNAIETYTSNIEKEKVKGRKEYMCARLLNLYSQEKVRKDSLYENVKKQISSLYRDLALFEYEYNFKNEVAQIDTLRTYIEKATTVLDRGSIYNKMSLFYEQRDLDSARHYSILAKNELLNIPFHNSELINSYNRLNRLCFYERKNYEGIMYANEVLKFDKYLVSPDSLGRFKAYYYRWWNLNYLFAHDDAYDDLVTAERYLDKAKYPNYFQQLCGGKIQLLIGKDPFDSVSSKIILETLEAMKQNVVETKIDAFNHNEMYVRWYLTIGDYKKALPYAIKALAYEENKEVLNVGNYTTACANLSQIMKSIGQHDRAIEYMYQSILTKQFNKGDEVKILAVLKDNSNYSFIQSTQLALLYFDKYKSQNQLGDLQKSKEYIALTDSIMYKQIKGSESTVILNHYRETGNSFFNLGMNVAWEDYIKRGSKDHILKFVNYSEQSKNSLMYRDISLEKELLTNNPILELTKNINAEINNARVKGMRDNEAFNQAVKKYVALESELKTKVVEYNHESFTHQVDSIPNILNKSLASNKSILHVSEIDSNIYFCVLNKDKYLLKRFYLDSGEKEKINSIIVKMDEGKNPYQDIEQSKLNAFLKKEIMPLIKEELIFVPDGYFHRIPIKLFLKKVPKITYLPSLKTMQETETKMSDPSVAVFAFSDKATISNPIRTALPELPGTITEVNRLQKLYPKAKIYTGKNATKENFIKEYENSSVDYIHLAVHGIANSSDDNNVKLYFRTAQGGLDSLYGHEILKYKGKAKKIVLSACESGLGKYYPGEGIYSLPRYFIIKGARYIECNFAKMNDNPSKQDESMRVVYKI